MTGNHTLESHLERLLKYGTIVCSVVIAVGVFLDVLNVRLLSVDLVTVGIIEVIILPLARIVTMLGYSISSRDIPMMKVVAIVLTLVAAGLVLGIVW